jgi:hypothetical protein
MIAPFNFVVPVAGTVLSAIFLGENILESNTRCAGAGVLGDLVGE